MQDSTFPFETKSENTDISKLLTELKLLASLFELKDNDAIVMSTIIKNVQDLSRNNINVYIRLN